jgi:hypothetical protein
MEQLSFAQRRPLAAKGRVLGRRVLDELTGLVTPDTILRWYRLACASTSCKAGDEPTISRPSPPELGHLQRPARPTGGASRRPHFLGGPPADDLESGNSVNA